MTKIGPLGVAVPVAILTSLAWMLNAASAPPAPPTPFPTELISTAAINVKTFGAYGDGTHDDSDAVAAAIALCVSRGTTQGGLIERCPPIFFPNGIYKISRPRALTPVCPPNKSLDGFTLIGESYKGVVIKYVNPDGWLFYDVDAARSVVMQNLVFNGSGGTAATVDGHLLYLAGMVGGRVFDLRLKDVDLGNAKELIRFEGNQLTSENRFDNVCLDVPAGCTGITWNNPQSVNHWFRNLNVSGAGTFFNIIAGGSIHIDNLCAELFSGALLVQVGPPSSKLGVYNDGIFISGARTEMFGTAQLVNNTVGYTVFFRDSNFAMTDNPRQPRVTGRATFDFSCVAPPHAQ
jgi:hypothetical protein